MKTLSKLTKLQREATTKAISTEYIAAWNYPTNFWLSNCQFQIIADQDHKICFWIWAASEEVIDALNINQNFLKGRSALLRAGCERIVFSYGLNQYADIAGVFDLK